MKVKVLILTGDGVNCERETKRAFEMAGANCDIIHINDMEGEGASLMNYQILALPGGFSFGDELGSGKVFSLKIKKYLGLNFLQFIKLGRPVIGICNGFQVLAKLGAFSGVDSEYGLAHNEKGIFIDQWAHLKVKENNCLWLKGIKEMKLPIRHGEGRFVFKDSTVYERFEQNGQIVLEYTNNPNGSEKNIAGVTDPSGVVLGLMPHPEAAVVDALYPGGEVMGTLGLKLFKNAVEYVKNK